MSDSHEPVTIYADTPMPDGVSIVSAVYSAPPAPSAEIHGNAIHLTVPPEWWVETDPGTLTRLALAGGIAINGVQLHVEAIEVDSNHDPVDPTDSEDVTAIYEVSGGNGLLATVRIGGGDYLLVATLYQA